MGPEEFFSEENFEIWINSEFDKHDKKGGVATATARVNGLRDIPLFDASIFRRVDGSEEVASASSSSSSSSSWSSSSSSTAAAAAAAGGRCSHGFSLFFCKFCP